MLKTKFMLRKLLSFTAAGMLLVQSAVICSAETTVDITYNAADESITAELDTGRKEKMATIAVKKDGKYWVIAEFARTDKDTFTYTCDLPADCPSGTYTAEVSIGGETATDSFEHINKEMAAQAMAIVNGASESTFASAIGQTYSELAVDLDLFNRHAALMAKLYYKYKPAGDLSTAQFSVHYNLCMTLCKLQAETDKAAVEAYLEDNADVIGFDYETYSEKIQEEKDEIISRFQKADYTQATLEAQYEYWFCLANINALTDGSVSTYEEALFETYKDILNLDATDYEKSADKKEVIKLVMENTYDSVEEIKEAFDKAVSKVGEEDDDDDRGSSGGGGGGSRGGSIGSVNWSEPVLDNKNETAASTENTNGNVASAFSDVASNHWCAAQIKSLYEKGIINGAGDGKFLPDKAVTRAEFSKMLICALFDGETKANNDFADVAEADWYYGYVGKAVELGLIMGDGQGAFLPNETISRQDMAVMLWRAFEKLELSFDVTAKSFADGDLIADYAKNAVSNLAGKGILNGMENGCFEPNGSLNRAQAAKALFEALTAANK